MNCFISVISCVMAFFHEKSKKNQFNAHVYLRHKYTLLIKLCFWNQDK